MKRRPLLAAAWTAAATVAGCLGSVGDPAGAPATDGGTGTRDGPEPRGPARGGSDADLSVRKVEDDDEVTYLEDEGAVEYVAAWRHANHDAVENGSEAPTREPVHETTPFDEWAETQCHSAAARAAAEHANDELDTDAVGGGISAAVEGHDLAAVVSVSTVLDREGDVVSETDVDFEALVAATPATVTATYVLDGREHEQSVPVYARYRVLRQQ